MTDRKANAIYYIAAALAGNPNGRALVMAARREFLRHFAIEEMMRNWPDEFKRANVSRYEVAHRDGGIVLLMTYDDLRRLQGYRFDIAVLDGDLPFARGGQVMDEVDTVMREPGKSPILRTRGLILPPQEECGLCGAHFGQHYVGCRDFPTAWPYHAVHYDGASHPVAVFPNRDEAARYGRERKGDAHMEVRPTQLILVKPGDPDVMRAVETDTTVKAFNRAGLRVTFEGDWHGSYAAVVYRKGDRLLATAWKPDIHEAAAQAFREAKEKGLL